jgi:glycosyltransferase involved in cell wall biosynthesis
MTNLFIVPIEPLEERYTGEWYKFFPEAFAAKGFTVTTIDGESLSDSVDVGTFLDMNSTIFYKAAQMQKIARMFRGKLVKDGDIFFISDLEFWGIESLRLMAQINGVKIQIYGFLHAASYTLEDAFAVAAPYQKYTELGWLKAVDGIFVGSHYHKKAIMERRVYPFADEADHKSIEKKIVVSGNPLFESAYDTSDLNTVKKQNKIVITNRFDAEKRPDQSLMTALLVKERLPDTEIVVTTSRPKFKSNQQWLVDIARMYERQGLITIKEGLTKKEYHDELKSAKVMLSNSIEENFGYCIVEAIMFNVAPVLTRGLSHNEIVQNFDAFLFDTNDEAVEKTIAFLTRESPFSAKHFLDSYFMAADFMGEYMVVNK